MKVKNNSKTRWSSYWLKISALSHWHTLHLLVSDIAFFRWKFRLFISWLFSPVISFKLLTERISVVLLVKFAATVQSIYSCVTAVIETFFSFLPRKYWCGEIICIYILSDKPVLYIWKKPLCSLTNSLAIGHQSLEQFSLRICCNFVRSVSVDNRLRLW